MGCRSCSWRLVLYWSVAKAQEVLDWDLHDFKLQQWFATLKELGKEPCLNYIGKNHNRIAVSPPCSSVSSSQ